ncbi:MAG TPA: sulfatase-like hydrolase/transferase, partial [Gammaproteobacteria bacterium]|nr:sulfatase-like hydrolase/transferase [Gammaproteobacteria bacterium]
MAAPITRRRFLRTLALSTTAALLAPLGCASNQAGRHPNIIFIMADDMGYGDPGCQNPESKIPTPNIDRLAAEGIRCTDAHSGSAVCTPTRYGVLTGRYSWRTRLKSGVLWGYSRPLIETDRMTVPGLLQQHGYRTGCIGKWHLGLGWQTAEGEPGPWEYSEDPESQWTGEHIDFGKPLTAGPHTAGFDYSWVIPASLDMAPYCYIENGKVVTLPTAHTDQNPPGKGGFWRAGPIAPDFAFPEVLPTLTHRATDFIDSHMQDTPDAPFFLYFPLTAPHRPIAPADFVMGKSQAGEYGDFVVEVDWTVGQVMEALKRKGIAGNTLII